MVGKPNIAGDLAVPFFGSWEGAVLLDDIQRDKDTKAPFKPASKWIVKLLGGCSPRTLRGLFNKGCDSTGL
jgi:hypothetical protein